MIKLIAPSFLRGKIHRSYVLLLFLAPQIQQMRNFLTNFRKLSMRSTLEFLRIVHFESIKHRFRIIIHVFDVFFCVGYNGVIGFMIALTYKSQKHAVHILKRCSIVSIFTSRRNFTSRKILASLDISEICEKINYLVNSSVVQDS